MLFTPETFLQAELDYHRERIASSFAAAADRRRFKVQRRWRKHHYAIPQQRRVATVS